MVRVAPQRQARRQASMSTATPVGSVWVRRLMSTTTCKLPWSQMRSWRMCCRPPLLSPARYPCTETVTTPPARPMAKRRCWCPVGLAVAVTPDTPLVTALPYAFPHPPAAPRSSGRLTTSDGDAVAIDAAVTSPWAGSSHSTKKACASRASGSVFDRSTSTPGIRRTASTVTAPPTGGRHPRPPAPCAGSSAARAPQCRLRMPGPWAMLRLLPLAPRAAVPQVHREVAGASQHHPRHLVDQARARQEMREVSRWAPTPTSPASGAAAYKAPVLAGCAPMPLSARRRRLAVAAQRSERASLS